MKSLAFRFFKYILVFVFFAGAESSAVEMGYIHHPYTNDQSFTNLVNDSYKHLISPLSWHKPYKTQTIAYLDKENLQGNLNFSYNDCVTRVGKEFLQELFATVILREIEHADEYRVFYHGFDRTFILFQDMYSGLYKIAYKKVLRDFVMLRIPDADFSKFKNVKDFLHHSIKNGDFRGWAFDHLDHVKKRLLSVNPSLFGNTTSFGECTFHYFMSSDSVSGPNVMRIVEDVFKAFSFQKLFERYKNDIEELKRFVSDYESAKTGGLLQIFIPESLVNALAYRCQPYGQMAYDDEKPEQHPASKDLDDYKRDATWADYSYDQIQFRLLINQKLLDPTSGIKMFRYCNETENMKQYNLKLKKLMDKMADDVRKGLS